MPLARVRSIPAGPDRALRQRRDAASAACRFIRARPRPATASAAEGAADGWSRKVARELGINVTGGSSSVADAWDVLRAGGGHGARAAARRGGAALEAAGRRADGRRRRRQPASGPRRALRRARAGAAATPPGDVALKAARRLEADRQPRAPRIDIAGQGRRQRASSASTCACRSMLLRGGAALPGDRRRRRRASTSTRALRAAGRRARRAAAGRMPARRPRSPWSAARWWHATRAARRRCEVEWRRRRRGALDTRADRGRPARRRGARRPGGGFVVLPARRRRRGDGRRGARTVEAGLPRAVPRARDDGADQLHRAGRATARSRCGRRRRCRAWRARSRRAVAGVAETAVTVHVTYLGGGFGRRLEVDVVGQAVRIALETGGRPVQLIWPREEDMTPRLLPAGRRRRAAARRSMRTAAGRAARSRAPATRSRRAGCERGLPQLAGPVDLPDKTVERRAVRPAVRDREPAHRARRDAQRRAGRLLALGRPFAQRVLLARASSTSWPHEAGMDPRGVPPRRC